MPLAGLRHGAGLQACPGDHSVWAAAPQPCCPCCIAVAQPSAPFSPMPQPLLTHHLTPPHPTLTRLQACTQWCGGSAGNLQRRQRMHMWIEKASLNQNCRSACPLLCLLLAPLRLGSPPLLPLSSRSQPPAAAPCSQLPRAARLRKSSLAAPGCYVCTSPLCSSLSSRLMQSVCFIGLNCGSTATVHTLHRPQWQASYQSRQRRCGWPGQQSSAVRRRFGDGSYLLQHHVTPSMPERLGVKSHAVGSRAQRERGGTQPRAPRRMPLRIVVIRS